MGKNIEILYNLKLFDGNFFRRRNLPPLNNKNFFYVEKLNRLCFTGNPTKAATVTFFGVYIAFAMGNGIFYRTELTKAHTVPASNAKFHIYLSPISALNMSSSRSEPTW